MGDSVDQFYPFSIEILRYEVQLLFTFFVHQFKEIKITFSVKILIDVVGKNYSYSFFHTYALILQHFEDGSPIVSSQQPCKNSGVLPCSASPYGIKRGTH